MKDQDLLTEVKYLLIKDNVCADYIIYLTCT